jgi:UDP-N-acetylmuramoyl-L-alanyl-D-glutamate--2,6-diaminopimelate ligase
MHPGVVGTVEVRLFGAEPRAATHTTPDAAELQRLCRENLERGGDTLVIEASSHALDQERLAGLGLDVAVFTNLGRDHLDYHPDMEAYAAAKERIFALVKTDGAAVVHAGDDRAERMIRAARRHGARVVTYGIGSRADLSATQLDVGPSGIHLFLEGMGIPRTGFSLPLVGRHNLENALAALAAVLLLGASPIRALKGLATASSPPGRLEPVDTGGRGFRVFVDYAHTPDALERVLMALDELRAQAEPRGRLLCVFGCGGERDREKRAPMGAVAGRLADLVWLTSDNPRSEDPEAILREVRIGLEASRAEVAIEPDRRAAIRGALARARPGDLVLIAGKGHETWQLSRGRKLAFDDRQVAREELP